MYGPCLSTIGGGQPLSSPKRHSLGEPLPHQLTDTVRASPKALKLYLTVITQQDYQVLVRLSTNYS